MAALGIVLPRLVVLAGAPWWSVAFVAVSPLLSARSCSAASTSGRRRSLTGALAALLADRHRLGWGLLGAAVAAKLYPPCSCRSRVVWTLRRRGGRELAGRPASARRSLALAFVPFLVARAARGVGQRGGQLSRPLQIESLAAVAR